jgi:ribosomal-protein-alanine N-acetyltransferase
VITREFRWPDIPAAVAIEAESFGTDRWSAESFWGELAGVPHRAHYFALADGAVLTGYAGVAFIDGDAHLQTIAVATSTRGQGYGRALLDEVLREATERQVRRCLLEVQDDNAAAIRMYERAGFEQISVRPRYYPGGRDALVLSRELPIEAPVTN